MSYKNNGIPMNFTSSQNNDKIMETAKCTNSGFNYGLSTKLSYDNDCIKDNIQQSVEPIKYVLDPNNVRNCKQCFSSGGASMRPSFMGWGDSLPLKSSDVGVAPAQQLSDIDSIMTNRNVKNDRSKKGKVNNVDLNKFKLYDSAECNNFLDPLNSTLTFPKQLYREMSINRFYALNNDPQSNIYYDGAVNSRLEASDNYQMPYPYSISGDLTMPTPNEQKNYNPYRQNGVNVNMVNYNITNNGVVPKFIQKLDANKNVMNNYDSDNESGYSTDTDM
jgi:hypothetical protein